MPSRVTGSTDAWGIAARRSPPNPTRSAGAAVASAWAIPSLGPSCRISESPAHSLLRNSGRRTIRTHGSAVIVTSRTVAAAAAPVRSSGAIGNTGGSLAILKTSPVTANPVDIPSSSAAASGRATWKRTERRMTLVGTPIADLAPVAEELPPGRVDEVLWHHPSGFRVLFAPADVAASEQVRPVDVRASIHAVRRACDLVVLDLTRSLEGAARVALDVADRVVVVLQLDVRSFRAAKRAIAAMGIEERCVFVVNRATRSEVTPADIERVFGRPAVVVIPVDRNVRTAQDRGQLLPKRGRTGRAVDRLARHLLETSG